MSAPNIKQEVVFEKVDVEKETTVSAGKANVWSIARSLLWGAAIIFLLFTIFSSAFYLITKHFRYRIHDLVETEIQEIDVFGVKAKVLKSLQTSISDGSFENKQTKKGYLSKGNGRIIEPGKFRKSDWEILPTRFKDTCEDCNIDEKIHEFLKEPNNDRCEKATVVVTVKSAVAHFEHRAAIRQSWANEHKDDAIIIFLLGIPDNNTESILSQVEEEYNEYEDMLLGNYIDSYSNLTVKALSGLKWRMESCAQPPFTLSVDDDTFVDLGKLLDSHLKKFPSKTQSFIECSERTVVNGKVWREGRWKVEEKTYDGDKYPTYCNGPCYLMPRETSQRLLETANQTVVDLEADDALISGVLRAKLNIPLIQYTRTDPPGWCVELNNRKPHLPKRMVKEYNKRKSET